MPEQPPPTYLHNLQLISFLPVYFPYTFIVSKSSASIVRNSKKKKLFCTFFKKNCFLGSFLGYFALYVDWFPLLHLHSAIVHCGGEGHWGWSKILYLLHINAIQG